MASLFGSIFRKAPLHERMRARISDHAMNQGFCIMPALGIIYASVPKVACTSLKAMFFELHGTSSDVNISAIHDVARQPWQHVSDYTVEGFAALIERRELRLVAFVRDPFARLASCYVNQFRYPLNYWDDPRRVGLRAQLLEDPMKPASFAEFVEAVARQRPGEMNTHWAPQTHQLCIPDLAYDFVGRVEAMEADIARLGGVIGRELKPVKAWNVTSAGSDLRSLYSPETEALAAKIYAQDFRTFGYRPRLA